MDIAAFAEGSIEVTDQFLSVICQEEIVSKSYLLTHPINMFYCPLPSIGLVFPLFGPTGIKCCLIFIVFGWKQGTTQYYSWTCVCDMKCTVNCCVCDSPANVTQDLSTFETGLRCYPRWTHLMFRIVMKLDDRAARTSKCGLHEKSQALTIHLIWSTVLKRSQRW